MSLTLNVVTRITTAPSEYDYPSMVISATPLPYSDRRGRQWRLLLIHAADVAYQSARYGSGLYPTAMPEAWGDQFIADIVPLPDPDSTPWVGSLTAAQIKAHLIGKNYFEVARSYTWLDYYPVVRPSAGNRIVDVISPDDDHIAFLEVIESEYGTYLLEPTAAP